MPSLAKSITKTAALTLAAAAALAAWPLSAGANQINTAAKTGLQCSFCPLSQASSSSRSSTTAHRVGRDAREHERVLATRASSARQLDVFALEARQLKEEAHLRSCARTTCANACSPSREQAISTSASWPPTPRGCVFYSPPGSAAPAPSSSCARSMPTGSQGQERDQCHLRRRTPFREALAADDTVSRFVQFADPTTRARARTQARWACRAGDRSHHPAQESRARRSISLRRRRSRTRNGSRAQGRDCVHAVVLFTGAPDRVQGERRRKTHRLIRTVAVSSRIAAAEETLFQRLLKRQELSASGTRRCSKPPSRPREGKPYTDKALDAAKEASDQAKQEAERASEAAKPYYDKSKEAAQKAYDDALKMAKELMEKSKQPDAPKKN